MRVRVGAAICTLALVAACGPIEPLGRAEIGNPYANVDWWTVSHYRADLHVHTLQSDGCHSVSEVVSAFRDAGFAILALTDHDVVAPNFCPPREAATPAQIQFGAFATERTPYPDPRPATFPADTTWPWSAFGVPSVPEPGMLAIQGSELTCTYHVGSYFTDYGVRPPCEASDAVLDDELREVARRGGLAVLNHPDTRQAPDWFVKLYREHSADSFIGIEIAADSGAIADTYVALWDRLLSDLMPSRPIWGFGTSDMHLLARTRFAFTVFLLDDLTEDNVKQAMRHGQFYSVVQPTLLNLSRDRGVPYAGRAPYDGTYPHVRSISVDEDTRRISIEAEGYDEIVWLSRRSAGDGGLSAEIVAHGPVYDFGARDAVLRYVRVELIRHTATGPIRLLLNPFAFEGVGRPGAR